MPVFYGSSKSKDIVEISIYGNDYVITKVFNSLELLSVICDTESLLCDY